MPCRPSTFLGMDAVDAVAKAFTRGDLDAMVSRTRTPYAKFVNTAEMVWEMAQLDAWEAKEGLNVLSDVLWTPARGGEGDVYGIVVEVSLDPLRIVRRGPRCPTCGGEL